MHCVLTVSGVWPGFRDRCNDKLAEEAVPLIKEGLKELEKEYEAFPRPLISARIETANNLLAACEEHPACTLSFC